MIKNKHFKDRSPKKTIKYIKKFFYDQKLNIKLISIEKTEINSWNCYIELWYKDYCIGQSNGKGITKNLCLASGFAELYERFCNKSLYYNKPLFNYFFNKNKKYYLSSDERILTLEQITNIPICQNYLNNYTLSHSEYNSLIIHYLTNGNIVGLPYINLSNKKIKYMDPRILLKINGTIGMSAGNSLEEALNQANAEIYEKYVRYSFFQDKFEKYYAYDLNLLQSKIIKKIIKKLQSERYKIYLLDLSYNYNMPVVLGILINPKEGSIYTNFGAHINFDIACERVFTELYQKYTSYKQKFDYAQPYYIDQFNQNKKIYYSIETNLNNFFPEDIFNKIEYKNYNIKIFNNTLQNNKDIQNYFINLNNQLGYNFYYRDVSLNKNIKAIQLFCDNLDINSIAKKYLYNQYHSQNIDFKKSYAILELIHNILVGIVNNQYNNLYYETLFNLINNAPNEYYYISELIYNSLDLFPTNYDLLYSLYNVIYNNLYNPEEFYNKYCFNNIKKYYQLFSYKNANYNDNIIIDLFINYYDYQCEQDELNNINNLSNILFKYYFTPLSLYLNEYISIINQWG